MIYSVKGGWNDVDSGFFKTSISLPIPDEIIDAIEFDVAHRQVSEAPHPLEGRMKQGGCYLYFCFYDWEEGTKPVYIYAGKSEKFSKRFWTHWRDEGRVEQFFQRYFDTGKLDLTITLSDGSSTVIQPHPIVRIALWFGGDKKRYVDA